MGGNGHLSANGTAHAEAVVNGSGHHPEAYEPIS